MLAKDKDLEDDVSTAKQTLDNFFNDGDGAQFASESALQDVISDLQTAKVLPKDTNSCRHCRGFS